MAPRQHRHRIAHALRRQRSAVNRIDRHIARRTSAGTDPFAVVKHGRVVLLTLTDDDDAIHRDGPHHGSHRRHRRGVGAVLVAPANPPPGCHRGRLGNSQ
jgi:hypothetical protein